MNLQKALLSTVLCLTLFISNGQDSAVFQKKRFIPVATGAGVCYITGMIGLYQIWYKDYPSESFHFFNDDGQWMQMDKCGHYFTAFQISRISSDVLSWTGTKRKKAIWYGAATGFLFQTNLELFDGFSSQWGFSVGDMTANTLGCASVLTQYLAWNELRIIPKISFHTTSYAAIHPDLLGENLGQQWLKDYNGQTYWLSFNVRKLTQQDFFWPKWLCISGGYGADAMVRGRTAESHAEGYYPYRQFYLSLDVDFQSIHSKKQSCKYLIIQYKHAESTYAVS